MSGQRDKLLWSCEVVGACCECDVELLDGHARHTEGLLTVFGCVMDCVWMCDGLCLVV